MNANRLNFSLISFKVVVFFYYYHSEQLFYDAAILGSNCPPEMLKLCRWLFKNGRSQIPQITGRNPSPFLALLWCYTDLHHTILLRSHKLFCWKHIFLFISDGLLLQSCITLKKNVLANTQTNLHVAKDATWMTLPPSSPRIILGRLFLFFF